MHLDSLKIKNFRILEDVTIEKLGHVNLIVGKNNSGKSTVLEALALLASGFKSNILYQIASNRSSLTLNPSQDTSVKEPNIFIKDFFTHNNYNQEVSTIFIGDTKNSIQIRVLESDKFDKHTYYDEIKHSLITTYSEKHTFSKTTKGLLSFNTIENGLEIKLSNKDTFYTELNLDDSLNLLQFLKLEQSSPLAYIDTRVVNLPKLASDWDKLVFTEAETEVIQALKIIVPNIQNLAFITDKKFHQKYANSEDVRVPYIKLLDGNGGYPLTAMGDGIMRLLQIILKIFSAKNGFLLIDEFENGLHYSVQPKVWELIFELAYRFNIQVFATTHSWDCIESFSQVAKDRTDMEGVLFRMGHSVRKSDKGKLIATVFDEDDLYNLTKMNIEVR
nr:ATP-binding protein [Moraxella sp. CTOTU47618]